MPKCPICGEEVTKPVKIWELNPYNGKGQLKITIYTCSRGHVFIVKDPKVH